MEQEDDEFPLHRAVFHRDIQRISDLLEQGEYPDLKNKSGNTALHLATELDYSYAFDRLIEHYADLDSKNELGETPLHLAVKKRNVEHVRKLLGHGANCLVKDQQRNTPIMLAALYNFEAGIYLLSERASIYNSDGNTFIHLLVLKKNSHLLEQVLQHGRSWDISYLKDEKGRNALQLAIVLGYQRGFELLLLHDVKNATEGDNIGRTALHIAVQKRNRVMIEQLVNDMPQLYAVNHNGMSAFDLAVAWKLEFVILLCLRKSVYNENGSSDQSHPLHMAVLRKNKTELSVLLNESSEIDAKDNQGRTPLHWAVIRHFCSGVNMLLRKGAGVNVEDTFGNTALHYSVLGKNKYLMETLVSQGADINHENKVDLTVIHLAVMHIFKAGVKFLIDRGADLNARGGCRGNSPLHFAVLSRKYSKKNMLRMLISQFRDNLHIDNRYGENVLYLALKNNLDSTAFFLLNNGVRAVDYGEFRLPILKSAICRPKEKLNIQLIKKLCENGADVNDYSEDFYDFPLHNAAFHKHSKAVKVLIDNGAHLNFRDSIGDTALHFAVNQSSDEEETLLTVAILIKHGANVNIRNRLGKTALHTACTSGFEKVFNLFHDNGARLSEMDNHSIFRCALEAKVQNINLVKRLLSLGFDPNPHPLVDYGMPPLNWAIYNSFYSAVKLLAEYGADVNFKADDVNYNDQMLLNAAECPDRTILDYLIDIVANVSQKSGEGTALHKAAKLQLYHNVDLLLRNEINVNVVDEMGNTALHVACQEHPPFQPQARMSIGIVKYLIGYGANINLKRRDGSTPLHLASKEHGEKIVEVLLNNGANINEQDVLGSSPLHIAAFRKKEEISNMLIGSGANLHLKNIKGEHIFHLIVKHQLTSCLFAIKKIASEVNMKDERGDTCLHIAVLNKNLDFLTILLSNNADTEVKNEDKLTATFLAASIGFHEGIYYLLEREIQPDIQMTRPVEEKLLNAVLRRDSQLIIELIESAADVNYKKYKSALHLAVLRDFKIGVEALIKAGANVNDADIHGNTSLHMAAIVRSIEIMDVLLTNGASVDSLNDDNRTAVHLAALIDFQEGVKMLCDKGASLHYKDCDGSTPIYLAVSKKKININKKIMKSKMHLGVLQNYQFGVKALMRTPGVEINYILCGKTSFNFDEIKNTSAIMDVLAIKEGDETEMIYLTSLTDFSQGIEKSLRCQDWIEDYDGNTPFYLAMPRPHSFAHLRLGPVVAASSSLVRIVGDTVPHKCGIGPLSMMPGPRLPMMPRPRLAMMSDPGPPMMPGPALAMMPDPRLHMMPDPRLHIVPGPPSLASIQTRWVRPHPRVPWTPVPLYQGSSSSLHIKALAMPTQNVITCSDLHLATLMNYKLGVQALIKAAASINVKDMNENTPLHLSVILKNASIMGLLLAAGAQLQSKNKDGRTALHLASLTNFKDGAEIIIDRGALLDIQDKDGNTPLHLAIMSHNEDLACELIQNGARMDINNCQNKSFLSLRLETEWPKWSFEELLVKLKIAIAENIESVYDPHPNIKEGQWRYSELMKLAADCKAEVVKMESHRFGKISIVEVLKDHRDPHFVMNDQLRHMIHSPTLEVELPNYASLLKSRFKRLERMYDQLSEACIRFPVLFESSTGSVTKLPTEVRRKILSALSADDLYSVLEVLTRMK